VYWLHHYGVASEMYGDELRRLAHMVTQRWRRQWSNKGTVLLSDSKTHQLAFAYKDALIKGCLYRTLGIVSNLVQVPVIDRDDWPGRSMAVLAIGMRKVGCSGGGGWQMGVNGAGLHVCSLL
jgi:hypothetical protein